MFRTNNGKPENTFIKENELICKKNSKHTNTNKQQERKTKCQAHTNPHTP